MLASRPVSQRMGGGGIVVMLLPSMVSRTSLPRPKGRWNPTVGVCLGPDDSPTVDVCLGPHDPRRMHFLMSEETVPTGKTNACLWRFGDFPSLGTNSGLPKCPSLVQCASLGTESDCRHDWTFGSARLWTFCTYCVLVWTICSDGALRSKMGG